MRDLAILLLHLVTICVRSMRPGGARSVVAESLLLKHPLLILNRPHQRAPRLRPIDRVVAALCAAWIHPTRLLRCAIVLKPSTIMRFHRSLVRRTYRWLFTAKRGGKPGPQGPSPEIVAAILEMKSRNPRFGCRRIAQQLAFTFGVEIDTDVVRRVLAKHYRPGGGSGPSWLTFLGHSKDSLWSLDLFRCESLFLRSHWVMVVMDQYTRRIVGFAAHACRESWNLNAWIITSASASGVTPVGWATASRSGFSSPWHPPRRSRKACRRVGPQKFLGAD